MPSNRQQQIGRPHVRGFTLIELMVVVAVVTILAAIAVPSMTELVAANRVMGATDELTSAIQLARSEAVRRNARVTVCASADGTTCANSSSWERWIVRGRDNGASAAGPEVIDIIRDENAGGSVEVSGPAGGIAFRPSGVIDAPATVCTRSTSYPAKQRQLTVMISGAISTGEAC